MNALELALIVLVAAVVAWMVIEVWTVKTGRATISEENQRLLARMDKQLIAGIFFILGALAGWFIAHFTSAPPG